jgi:hypothetical protein
MQPSYKLIITDKKYERYKKMASFIFGVNAIVFIILALQSLSISNQLILCTSSIILIGYSIYNWAYKKKKENSYILVYLLMAVIWVSDTPYWYFSILILLLLALQYRMESNFSIYLTARHITIDGFTKKNYGWQDFNNIVLKDGLLTLDFRSNKIMQVEPDWNKYNNTPGTEPRDTGKGYPETEQEFNDFCRQYLNK